MRKIIDVEAKQSLQTRGSRLALPACVAALMLILGFAYGATFDRGCDASQAPFGCVEFVINRYQSLIAIVGAIAAAVITAKPVWHQLNLQQQQYDQMFAEHLKQQEKLVLKHTLIAEKIASYALEATAHQKVMETVSSISPFHAQKYLLPELDQLETQGKALLSEFEESRIDRWGGASEQAAQRDIIVGMRKIFFRIATKRIPALKLASNVAGSEAEVRATDLEPDSAALRSSCAAFEALCETELRRIVRQRDRLVRFVE